MNSRQTKRLLGVLFILILCTAALVLILFALKQNINLFLTPSELTALSSYPTRPIRLGGYVKKGSVYFNASGQVKFIITDRKQDILVHYPGVLPNLFREGQTVVITGKILPNHLFVASQVLAKHDERYMPKIIEKTLQVKAHGS